MLTCLKCGNELKSKAEIAFEEATTKLFRDNSDVRVYEVCGQTVFPVYGSDGSPTTRQLFYLWRPLSQEIECVALWLKEDTVDQIKYALDNWDSIKKVVREGDCLGMPCLT